MADVESRAESNLSKLRQLLHSEPRVATSRPVKLQNVLQQFVAANEDASKSANFVSQTPDDLTDVVALMTNVAVMAPDDMALRVLKTLKILSRKYENRVRLGELIVPDLVRVLVSSDRRPCSARRPTWCSTCATSATMWRAS